MTESGGRRRVANASVLAVAEFASRLVAFVATAYLAVVLSPEQFGLVGFAFAVVTYLAVFVDVGFTDVGSRQVSREAGLGDVETLTAGITVVRIGVALGCLLVLAAAAPLLRPDRTGQLVIVFMGLLVLTAGLDVSWVYKGLGRSVRIGVSLVARRLCYAALVFLFIRGPDDVVAVPLLQVAGETVGVVWLGFALLSAGFGAMTRQDLARAWATFRSSGSLMMAKLLRTSVVTLDVVLLGFLSTDYAVGIYSSSYRICFLVMALAGAVQVAYLPDVTRGEGSERRTAARRHLESSAALGVPIAVGGALVAGPLVELAFGSEYLPGVAALRVLLVSVGFLFLFSPVHNVLLAQGHLHRETRAVGVAAGLNLVLNLVLIPRYGIMGAAWSTLIAEATILGLCIRAAGEGVRGLWLGPVVRPLVASVAMAAALTGFGLERTPLLTIPVGALVYVVALLAIGGIPADAADLWRRRGARPTSGAGGDAGRD